MSAARPRSKSPRPLPVSNLPDFVLARRRKVERAIREQQVVNEQKSRSRSPTPSRAVPLVGDGAGELRVPSVQDLLRESAGSSHRTFSPFVASRRLHFAEESRSPNPWAARSVDLGSSSSSVCAARGDGAPAHPVGVIASLGARRGGDFGSLAAQAREAAGRGGFARPGSPVGGSGPLVPASPSRAFGQAPPAAPASPAALRPASNGDGGRPSLPPGARASAAAAAAGPVLSVGGRKGGGSPQRPHALSLESHASSPAASPLGTPAPAPAPPLPPQPAQSLLTPHAVGPQDDDAGLAGARGTGHFGAQEAVGDRTAQLGEPARTVSESPGSVTSAVPTFGSRGFSPVGPQRDVGEGAGEVLESPQMQGHSKEVSVQTDPPASEASRTVLEEQQRMITALVAQREELASQHQEREQALAVELDKSRSRVEALEKALKSLVGKRRQGSRSPVASRSPQSGSLQAPPRTQGRSPIRAPDRFGAAKPTAS